MNKMNTKESIEAKLKHEFAPFFLQVINESDAHNVAPGSETHFKVLVVSSIFDGKRAVQRHQKVYQTLNHELKHGVHALALHTFTQAEWAEQATVAASPNCLGGDT